jgi:hypothetical protein
MHARPLVIAALAVALVLGAARGAVAPLSTDAAAAAERPGVYLVWGAPSDARPSYVRGGQIVVEWPKIQPRRNRFDWSSLDRQLREYRRLGKGASVQINSTHAKPKWLWKRVARCGTVRGQEVPRYWDPAYLRIQKDLVGALARHLRRSRYRGVVTVVRASPNAIGTELTDVPRGSGCRGWTPDVGRRYFKRVMGVYRKELAPRFNVALRAQLFTTHTPRPPLRWLGRHVWLMGTASDIDPNPTREAFDLLSERRTRTGRTKAYWEPHYTTGKKHLVSWNYWRLLLELEKGVSYVAVYAQEIRRAKTDREYRSAFGFVNRYAGSHARPGRTPGAWVALREGTGRTAGNFGWFMRQLHPGRTSVAVDSDRGRNPIGPARQRYGRFARRIEGGTRRDTMSFQLSRKFRRGVHGRATTLRVTYLDAGRGSFRVRWGTGAAETRTVRLGGSGTWKQLSVRVPGSAFHGRLAGRSDIALSALGSTRATFHMVEVRVPGRG